MVSNASALGPRTDLDPPQLPPIRGSHSADPLYGLSASGVAVFTLFSIFCSLSCFDILSLYALANVPPPHHLDAIRTLHTIRGLSYLLNLCSCILALHFKPHLRGPGIGICILAGCALNALISTLKDSLDPTPNAYKTCFSTIDNSPPRFYISSFREVAFNYGQSSTSARAHMSSSPSIETGLPTDSSNQEGLQNYLIEADSSTSDLSDDQGIGDDLSTYTASLASSVSNYQYENGRRYNGYRRGNYFFPNDQQEIDRLHLQHHMISILFGGRLHWAPINPNPQNILDIGTGTGSWAVDIADMYPSAHVIGTDLSPIQSNWVPPNLVYEIDDAESEWTYKHDSFDLIHTRYLAGTFKDWPKFIRRSFTATKPGGWLECQEVEATIRCDDATLLPDSALVKWGRLFHQAAESYGRSVVAAVGLADWMEDAGYVNVTNRCFKLPNNPWPKDPKMKEVGMYQMVNFLDGLQALTVALFTRALGWTLPEVDAFLVDVRKDIKNRNIHSYVNFYVAYGQKPQ